MAVLCPEQERPIVGPAGQGSAIWRPVDHLDGGDLVAGETQAWLEPIWQGRGRWDRRTWTPSYSKGRCSPAHQSRDGAAAQHPTHDKGSPFHKRGVLQGPLGFLPVKTNVARVFYMKGLCKLIASVYFEHQMGVRKQMDISKPERREAWRITRERAESIGEYSSLIILPGEAQMVNEKGNAGSNLSSPFYLREDAGVAASGEFDL